MTHYMGLDPKPFAMISSGQKTIELRLNDEKRQKIKIGDSIVFSNTTNSSEIISVTVINIYKFESFKELYDVLPLEKCGYEKEEIVYADPKDMEVYYSIKKQKQYGVLGIEISI